MKNYTIAIATFYPGDIINKCLASLPTDKEILIIDNGNDKKLMENLSKINNKNISYHNIGDVGISKSLNYAVSKSSNNYVFITQPDVIVSSKSIDNLINAYEKYNKIGIASPLIFDDNNYSQYDHYSLKISKKGKVLNNKEKENRDAMNTALKIEYDKMIANGYKNIFYIDSENALGSDYEGTVDGVHFTDLGFKRYADYLIEKLEELKLL